MHTAFTFVAYNTIKIRVKRFAEITNITSTFDVVNNECKFRWILFNEDKHIDKITANFIHQSFNEIYKHYLFRMIPPPDAPHTDSPHRDRYTDGPYRRPT